MKPISLSDAIWSVSIITTYIPIFIAFYKRKALNTYLYALTAALIISALSDSLGFVFVKLKIHTYLLYNIQDVLQFILLSLFYYRTAFRLHEKMNLAIFLPCSIFYLSSFIVISLSFQNPFLSHQNIMWTISGAILIVYGCVYYNVLLIELSTVQHIRFNNLVWINSGILYYFSFTIFLFLLQAYFASELEAETFRLIWGFGNVNNIIKNILIIIGLTFYTGGLDPRYQNT